MKVLALELSSSRGSIALRVGAEEVFAVEFANDRKHSGLFFTNLQRAIAEHGNPDQIAVGLGPGSYAGTRIAIAAAIGLQAVSGATLIGVPSLCALPTDAAEYAVIGDARRQSFFFARVGQRDVIEGPALWSETELRARTSEVDVPVFTSEPLLRFPDAQVMHPSASLIVEVVLAGCTDMTSAPLEPIYLREPHITRPKAAK
jgi:tRNA threonylcarbamoyl adenosine modification protein YeaZ